MVVCISGDNIRKELAYSVIVHCYNQLIPSHDINIDVLLRTLETKRTDGWCQHNNGINYEISVDKSLSTNQFIKTLCHEMVHVKQGGKNELVEQYTTKYQPLWKGTRCDEYDLSSPPWELEAYQLEEELYNSFMEQNEKK